MIEKNFRFRVNKLVVRLAILFLVACSSQNSVECIAHWDWSVTFHDSTRRVYLADCYFTLSWFGYQARLKVTVRLPLGDFACVLLSELHIKSLAKLSRSADEIGCGCGQF